MPENPQNDVPSPKVPIELETYSVEHQMPTLSLFCNHMIVQGDGQMMYVTFFQLRPPVLLASDLELTSGEPGKLKAVKAQAVASVVIDRSKLQRFIDVLQEQVNVWKEDDASSSSVSKAST